MRSRTVLSTTFVAAAVPPVTSVPASTQAEPSRWDSRRMSVRRRTWTPPSIPSPPPVPSCWQNRTCKRQDIESEIVNVIHNAVRQSVISQDEANTLLQLPQLMTTPEDLLLLLKSLRSNPTSLLPTNAVRANNSSTQVKREWGTPPPIPSCWGGVKREWTPPPIPSCWWSGSYKPGVDLDSA
ncbi:hypothetical protein OG21DRAFT_1481557 [Imleria badia]|nr:hypothetical protein OG21DRAFT_1481557 [Imleria badia]